MSLLLGPLGIQITSTDLVLNAPMNAVPPVVVEPRGTDYESPAPAPSFTAYTLDCASGAYAYLGSDATLTKAGLTAYTLAVLPGSYAYAGSTVTFKTVVNFSVAAGSYAYAGATTAFKTVVKFTANPGAYGYAGSASTLKTGRVFPVAPGAYAYAGSDATLTYTPGSGAIAYSLAVLPGAYAYVGNPADLSATGTTPVVVQGGHGSAWTEEDEELEQLQRRLTAIAIKSRQEREKKRKLEEEIERQKQEAVALAEQQEAIAKQRAVEKKQFKVELLQVLLVPSEERFQSEHEHKEKVEKSRIDYLSEKEALTLRKKTAAAHIRKLQKEREALELEQEHTRILQETIQKEMEQRKRADDEAAELIRKVSMRRRREAEWLIMGV